jgi:molybdenum cofactor guanylyltransferase
LTSEVTSKVIKTSVQSDAVGFVLAGGRSSRMGTDKALVNLGARPLIAHAVEILREAGLAASIAGGDSALAGFAPLIEDRRVSRGPLSGIVTALASASSQWAVFIPVDLPLLPASLLVSMLRSSKIKGSVVTLASVNGFTQTFPAVVTREALPILERELAAGRGGCFSAFQAAAGAGQSVNQLAVESLVQCGHAAHPQALPAAYWFLNVNTPENLRRAEILSAQALIA